MRTRIYLLLLFTALPIFAGNLYAQEKQPNILLVMMDDVGFADLGSYGSDIRTPNLDALANNGLRYTNFTVTGVCSPSRAALLTGLNHHSAGVGHASDLKSEHPGYRGVIHDNVLTLPEILRDHGYATMMTGKWHLSHAEDRNPEGPYDSWPTGRGFDDYWGFLSSHTSQWVPSELWDGKTAVDMVPYGSDFYFPDVMTDKTIEMLEAHLGNNPETPFLFFYSTPAGHAPHHTKPEDRARYTGLYDEGYDVAREKRLARQKKQGFFSDDVEVAPYYPGVQPWEGLSDEEKLISTRLQENYAAFIDNMDQNIGRVIAWLEKNDVLDNTIVIVMSDNGGSREAYTNGVTNQGRYFFQAGETHEQRMRELPLIGGTDSYPNYPLGWMQVSNTPFKLSKASVHGGGIRSPLIVHWPAAISDGGSLRTQFHHINDITPTILELLDIEHPANNDASLKPMEGVSLAYSLNNPDAEDRKLEQYYEMEGNRAWYDRGWRLASWHRDGESYEDYPWELYNVAEDPTESNDLAAAMPDKVESMAKAFQQAGERYDVFPINDAFFTDRTGDILSQPAAKVVLPNLSGPHNPHILPAIVMRSGAYTLNVKHEAGSNGVLFALGDIHGGMSLYVKDDHLAFEVNRFGEFQKLVSENKLPAGDHEISVQFDHDSLLWSALTGGLFDRLRFLGGDISLLVNGEPFVEEHLSYGFPFGWEGLDVGMDRGSPVTHSYKPPFRYQGDIGTLVIESF